MDNIYLCGMDADEIADLIRPGGFTHSYAVIVAGLLYKKGSAALEKSTRIPQRLKKYLSEVSNPGINLPVRYEKSADGTIKYLFESTDGKLFESVFLPDEKRKTVCVSTQSGCRMGCPFCVTGRYGFHGSLSAGEIVSQVISLQNNGKITHVVFMGMGEPMDNLENVLKACRILTAEWGMAISTGNITVSSVGITPAIKEFLEKSDCNLALSLYSPFHEERMKVVPAENAYPVKEIINMMSDYPLKKKRRMTIAYVMISGINDTDIHLEGLIRIAGGTQIRINLLPFHAIPGDDRRSSSDERLQFFKHNLVISGISASVRKSRGADISAACGLLASGLM